MRKISKDGVEFQSHVDGATLFLGPVESMAAHPHWAAILLMAFDECPHWPCDQNTLASSWS